MIWSLCAVYPVLFLDSFLNCIFIIVLCNCFRILHTHACNSQRKPDPTQLYKLSNGLALFWSGRFTSIWCKRNAFSRKKGSLNIYFSWCLNKHFSILKVIQSSSCCHILAKGNGLIAVIRSERIFCMMHDARDQLTWSNFLVTGKVHAFNLKKYISGIKNCTAMNIKSALSLHWSILIVITS